MLKFQRINMQNPAMGELSLSYFRHWLSIQLNSGQGSGLAAGYAAVYRSIWYHRTGTQPHSHFQAISNFLEILYAGVAEETVHQVANEVRAVLVAASGIIGPLMEEKTKRKDPRLAMNRDLTCMGIEDEELPWVKK